MRLIFTLLLFGTSLSNVATAANHLPTNCPERLQELRESISESQILLREIPFRSAQHQQRLFEQTNKYLFFENELNQLIYAVSNLRSEEDFISFNQQKVQQRLQYLYIIPQYPQVMNEIFSLQQFDADLVQRKIKIFQNKIWLEKKGRNLRNRLKEVRQELVSRESELRKITAEHFGLDRAVANDLTEINFLSSLDGQNACSENSLIQAKSELAEKQKLADELQRIKIEADKILAKSKSANSKIQQLLSELG